jgi:hypothetical protein
MKLHKIYRWIRWYWLGISYAVRPYNIDTCEREWRGKKTPSNRAFDEIIRVNYPDAPKEESSGQPAVKTPNLGAEDLSKWLPKWEACRLNQSPHWCFINSEKRRWNS